MRSVGTAATALAVSCVAGATTLTVSGRPAARATAGDSGPNSVPGGTIGPKRRSGRSSRPISSRFQSRVVGSTSCVVVALVNSTASDPHRQRWNQSGISTIRRAADSSSGWSRRVARN